MQTIRLLGYLLSYPEVDLADACSEIEQVIAKEKLLNKKQLKQISALIGHINESDLLDLQEEYVSLFDRTPSLSLHMFEHVHGDSRDRGPAMVDLSNVYEQEGLEVANDETPDYLPLFLEFVSILPPEKAKSFLGEVVNILAAIEGRLKKRKSPYAAVFGAFGILFLSLGIYRHSRAGKE